MEYFLRGVQYICGCERRDSVRNSVALMIGNRFWFGVYKEILPLSAL